MKHKLRFVIILSISFAFIWSLVTWRKILDSFKHSLTFHASYPFPLYQSTRSFIISLPSPIPNPHVATHRRTIYSRFRNITFQSRATTPWPRYRLGDIFRSHIFRIREDGWNLHHKAFSTSLAVEYMTRIKYPFIGSDSDYLTMIQIVNERIQRNETLQSMLPDALTLVIHLRTGDVIDIHTLPIREYLSFDNATASSCNGHWYTRGLPFYADIWDQIQSEGIQIQRILVITGWHFKHRHTRSIAYINEVIKYFEKMVDRVDIRVNENPDEDFMIMSRSKYFVASGGGFSMTIGGMVERNGGRVFGYYLNRHS